MILDTHVFLWWVDGDRRISVRAARAIEETLERKNDLLVSSISVWEIAKLVEYGRIGLKYDVLDWVTRSLDIPHVRLVPLEPRIAVKSAQLPGEFHGDPADQIIVATALVMGVGVITADRRIRAYKHVRSVW